VWRRGRVPFALLGNSRKTDSPTAAKSAEFRFRLAPRLAACALLLLPGSLLFGQDAAQIMEQAQQRATAKSQHYEGLLQVTDSKHKISTKSWTLDRIGSFGDSKAILRFTAPAEVKGLAVLILNHADHSSDQWMWTPAIQRERRIALQDRSTRFFGTDFSFEDLEERDIKQFDYKLAGDAGSAWKIEARPKQSKSSQYTSSLFWVRKDNFVVVQIENYANDKLIRRLKYSDIEKIDNIWTPRTVEVYDTGRDSTTVMKLEKLQYNVPMEAEDFTVEALHR